MPKIPVAEIAKPTISTKSRMLIRAGLCWMNRLKMSRPWLKPFSSAVTTLVGSAAGSEGASKLAPMGIVIT